MKFKQYELLSQALTNSPSQNNLLIRIFFLGFLFSTHSLLLGQDSIHSGTNVCIDGILEPGEWNDAAKFVMIQTPYVNSHVLLKHNNTHFLLAYVFENITDSTITFPELFIDTKLNKGDAWQNDDYWFHVSAQDCYSIGKREDYSKCRTDYTVWRASPNYPFGSAYEKINAIELSIPFDLIHIKVGQTIGLCMSVSIFPKDIRINFPPSAHEDKPSTWMAFGIHN